MHCRLKPRSVLRRVSKSSINATGTCAASRRGPRGSHRSMRRASAKLSDGYQTKTARTLPYLACCLRCSETLGPEHSSRQTAPSSLFTALARSACLGTPRQAFFSCTALKKGLILASPLFQNRRRFDEKIAPALPHVHCQWLAGAEPPEFHLRAYFATFLPDIHLPSHRPAEHW